MKKIYLSLIVFLLVFLPLVSAGELKKDLSEIVNKTPATEKIKVIILFHGKPMPTDISTIKSDGAKIKHQYNIINGISAEIPAQAAKKIAKRTFVKLVEPDYKVKLVLDKSIPQIQADNVWQEGVTGKGIDVAVLDTGIHDEHPALTIEKEIDYTGEGTDDLNGHGTYVAGIIASTNSIYKGVSYNADLFNVKVLNKDGIGYGSDIIKGIEWAVDNGAEIISMSFGAEIDPCDGTDAISQAVDNAVSRGVVAVVAAGNLGPDQGTITSPGCSKKGITVGAVDNNDNVQVWSSRGPTDDGRIKPDLVAPGVDITSAWIDNSFRSLSGTSASTPHVSGVIALLLEINSTLKPSDILDILKITAVNLSLDENTQGAGRVDAYGAYLYLINLTETESPQSNETEETGKNKSCDWLPPGLRKKELLPRGWQKKCPEADLTPDSFWYRFKRFKEGIVLRFTFNEEKKVMRLIQYSEERLAETAKLIEENKTEFIDDLIEDYDKKIEEVNKISELAREQRKNTSNIDEVVAEATSMHVDILKEILKKIPEQAKPAIQKAINFSNKGNKKALNSLEKVKPEKAAEIHLKIAERKLEQVRERTEEGCSENCEEEVEELLEEYEEKISQANHVAETVKQSGKEDTNVNQVIERATSKHEKILKEVQNKVPKQKTKDSIERAIGASSKGKEKASEGIVKTIEKKEFSKSEEGKEKSEGNSDSNGKTGEKINKKEITTPASNIKHQY